MAGDRIFDAQPNLVEEVLVLPLLGEQIKLYPIKGTAYPDKLQDAGDSGAGWLVHEVYLYGQPQRFKNSTLNVPGEFIVRDAVGRYCNIEIFVRIFPVMDGGISVEVVAISYDERKTFFENQLSSLFLRYTQANASQ